MKKPTKPKYNWTVRRLVNALKKSFPGVSFSLHKMPGVTLFVYWEQGPTPREVRSFLGDDTRDFWGPSVIAERFHSHGK